MNWARGGRAVTVHLFVDFGSGLAVMRGACSLLLHLTDIRAVRLAPLDLQSSAAFREYVLANLRNGAWPLLKRVRLSASHLEHGSGR